MKQQLQPNATSQVYQDESLLSEIASFLPNRDIRTLASTCCLVRSILTTSQGAQNIWAHRMLHNSSASNYKQIEFADNYHLSVAGLSTANPINRVNLSLLTGLTPQCYPKTIDPQTCADFHSYLATSTLLERYDQQEIDQHEMYSIKNTIQFEGEVGIGNRCVQSDKPFPTDCQGKSTGLKRRVLKSFSAWIKKKIAKSEDFSTSQHSKAAMSMLPSRPQQQSKDSPLFQFLSSVRHASTDNSCPTPLLGSTITASTVIVDSETLPPEGPSTRPNKSKRKKYFTPTKRNTGNNFRPFVIPTLPPSSTTTSHGTWLPVDVTPQLVAYFEVTLVKQAQSVTSCVAIGLSTKSFPLTGRLPGWNTQSWGYHSDDGAIFHEKKILGFGPLFGEGDTVGCGIEYTSRTVFFTRNGQLLAYDVNDKVSVRTGIIERGLYPTIGIDTSCPLFVNFGSEAFKFDVKRYGARMLRGDV